MRAPRLPLAGETTATLSLRASLSALVPAVNAWVLSAGGEPAPGARPPRLRRLRRIWLLSIDGWATVLDSDHKLRDLAVGIAGLGTRVLVQPQGNDFRVTNFAEDGVFSAVVPEAVAQGDESLRDRDMLPGLSYDDLVTVVRRSFISYAYTPAAEQLEYWYEA